MRGAREGGRGNRSSSKGHSSAVAGSDTSLDGGERTNSNFDPEEDRKCRGDLPQGSPPRRRVTK